MFNIQDKYKTIYAEWTNIVENMHIFHFDEFPILYAGTNSLGGKIIGSLVCEDDEGEIFRYFHCLVSTKQYSDFVKKKKSYRDLIDSMSSIFVLDKDISDNILNTYHIHSNEIPKEYLPLQNVFCPNIERAIGFDYSVSLQGKMADIHEAFSNTLANISKSANKVFSNFGDALKIKSLNPHVHQLAYSEGSFKVNFRIKVENTGLYHNEDALKKYFQKCLDYSVNTLPVEADKLATGNINETVFEKDLIPSIMDVYKSFSYKFEDSYVKDVIDNMIDSIDDIEDISTQIGKGFTGIEFIGFDNKKEEVSIGFIDKEFATKIRTVSKLISEIPNESETTDDSYNDYRIQIYDINTDTRKGIAHITNDDDTDIMDNPKIFIDGEANLIGSIFTESLHLNKWITVKAKAKKGKGKFKLLTIKF